MLHAVHKSTQRRSVAEHGIGVLSSKLSHDGNKEVGLVDILRYQDLQHRLDMLLRKFLIFSDYDDIRWQIHGPPIIRIHSHDDVDVVVVVAAAVVDREVVVLYHIDYFVSSFVCGHDYHYHDYHLSSV